MKKQLIVIGLAISLSGCAGFGQLLSGGFQAPPAPATYANSTILDEQAALAVELAYKAARSTLEFAVDAGFIKGQRAVEMAKLDNKAYLAVGLVRRAYRTGNSTDYSSALSEARLAISDLLALANSK